MVHRKYIKIKGKTYGPYYYESYRENGKVKKRYIKPKKSRVKSKQNKTLINNNSFIYFVLILLVIIALFSFFGFPNESFSEIFYKREILLGPSDPSFGTDGNVNLLIYDETDSMVKRSGDSVTFFAEFTDTGGGVIDDSSGGSCQIHYNYDGIYTAYESMIFDVVDLRWEASQSFNYVGISEFEIDCSNGVGAVIVSNQFVITNTPVFFHTWGISKNGLEDTVFEYNFSANISDVDINDVWNFIIEDIDGPLGASAVVNDYGWISIDMDTGVMLIDAKDGSQSGTFIVSVFVSDLQGEGESRQFTFNIGEVNDAPQFIGLVNKSFNATQIFDYVIVVNDEEGNVPFVYDIDFLSCDTAQWSDRGSVNCDLFDNTMYTADDNGIHINFLPSRNDVGDYVINFSVSDSNIVLQPFNAQNSVVVNFTVVNINQLPYFYYDCVDERSALEELEYNCYVNATDIDEENNLTFSTDPIWFYNGTVDVDVTTNFNGTVFVNFTPDDDKVGNWAVNITVMDTGKPVRYNSTVFDFYVENVDDAVVLFDIDDVTVYTGQSVYRIDINASDGDILIPDKSIYDEVLSFSSDNVCVRVISPFVVFKSNTTQALVEFNPNDAGCFVGGQNYDVTIIVDDFNGFSTDMDVFNINVIDNNAPIWLNPVTENELIEDMSYYVDLSTFVSEPEDEVMTFISDDINFASFGIDINTGVIDFTPSDIDVGEHIFYINVSDGISSVPLLFNYTVYNVNDNPNITTQLPFQGVNFSIPAGEFNINVKEDDRVEMFVFVEDDDLRILELNNEFYMEEFLTEIIIVGPNETLIEFFDFSLLDPNLIGFRTIFTPRKGDVGIYNVTFNVTDVGNVSTAVIFNLTVIEIEHQPVIDELSDQNIIADVPLIFDVNTNDLEDGNDSDEILIYSYDFLSGGDFINGDESIFNLTSGVFDYTFDNTQIGAYNINITVIDSFGFIDSDDFWVYVYDLPTISTPGIGFLFDLIEGDQKNVTFEASSGGVGNLTYLFYIGDKFRDSLNYYGDGTALTYGVIPEYVDETFGLTGNLSLVVAVPGFEYINASMLWDANIAHANGPVIFFNSISDKQSPRDIDIEINLRGHFFDADDYDTDQEFNFRVESNMTGENPSVISWSIDDWILKFNSPVNAVEIFNVTVSDLDNFGIILTSNVSNNFEVKFIDPVNVPQPTSGGGGGGGGGGGSSRTKPVSLRIIVPDPISTRKGELLILPLKIVNDGPIELSKIKLGSSMIKSGILRDDMEVKLNRNFIDLLPSGAEVNLTMTIQLSQEVGIYEININADVDKPDYSDSAKMYISVEEGQTLGEKLLFVEELIVENPECIELKELIDESREFLNQGDFINSQLKADEAINACRETISRQSVFSFDRLRNQFDGKIFLYLLIAIIFAVLLGVGYYIYQIILQRKALASVEQVSQGKI
jgi:hypothetical protein